MQCVVFLLPNLFWKHGFLYMTWHHGNTYQNNISHLLNSLVSLRLFPFDRRRKGSYKFTSVGMKTGLAYLFQQHWRFKMQHSLTSGFIWVILLYKIRYILNRVWAYHQLAIRNKSILCQLSYIGKELLHYVTNTENILLSVYNCSQLNMKGPAAHRTKT